MTRSTAKGIGIPVFVRGRGTPRYRPGGTGQAPATWSGIVTRGSTRRRRPRLVWGLVLGTLLLLLPSGAVVGQAERQQAIRRCTLLGGDPVTREFLRCLVDRYGWTPEAAAAVAADTIVARERVAARRARTDSIARARARAQAMAEELAAWARTHPTWISSDSAQLFYAEGCAEAKRIVGADRRVWSDTLPLKLQGFHRSTAPGC